MFFGSGYDEETCLLDFFVINGIFIEADLWLHNHYLITFLVFLHEFFKISPRVTQLLLTYIENDLTHTSLTTFWLLINFNLNYYFQK